MITFHVRCRLRDGQLAAAAPAITELVARVQLDERDAVHYSFFRSSRDPQEIVLVESYTSNEAFLAHNESPHMLRFRARFTELFDPATTEVTMLQDLAGFGREWSAVPEASVVR
ncbi:MAG TPA: antibiotic biosynthesis monooxygenase [Dehalococcoidia bacterium]|jgi:quinol monooxygenase YgiN|nr:antibiotic biosynthesis monooxygenase [Dehalococcoidia bacterium]